MLLRCRIGVCCISVELCSVQWAQRFCSLSILWLVFRYAVVEHSSRRCAWHCWIGASRDFFDFVDVSRSSPHAVPLRAREAYVTVAAGDVLRFPNYVYGALALMASVRQFRRQSRHRIVLADALALGALSSCTRVFRTKWYRCLCRLRRAMRAMCCRLDSSAKWRGAFSKLAIFDLDLLGYRTLVYLDADSDCSQ
jgi:hypothetical protein